MDGGWARIGLLIKRRMDELIERIAPGTKRAFLLGFGVALAVLASTVISGLLYLRSTVCAQIVSRDAAALYATTVMEQLDAAAADPEVLGDDQLALEAALLASRLKGVIGIRFFDNAGKFKDSFPANIQPRDLPLWAQKVLRTHQPSGLLARDIPLDQVFIYLSSFSTGHIAKANILQVVVPLHSADATQLVGAAEFILEGESIASEYSRLDRQLGVIGTVALVLGGTLLGLMLWPVFHRAQKLTRTLEAQNLMLQRANEELALAARASALGAVSAHLMHGLKNPLASLSDYLRGERPRNGKGQLEEAEDLDRSDALNAARRIQNMVDETLEVLADARGEACYQISPTELVNSICAKAALMAKKKGVVLVQAVNAPAVLPSRIANLVRLILSNLVDNAIQASPSSSTVTVSVEQMGAAIQRYRIKDQGPGFPSHLLQKLFLPCKSTKGGSGLGLAISHQLAEYLGSKISLVSSSSEGCLFEFELPLNMASQLGADTHS